MSAVLEAAFAAWGLPAPGVWIHDPDTGEWSGEYEPDPETLTRHDIEDALNDLILNRDAEVEFFRDIGGELVMRYRFTVAGTRAVLDFRPEIWF